VGRLDDLFFWKHAQIPRWKKKRCELGFGVPGRHVDDQPLQFPSSHPFKCICHDFVMFTGNKRSPHLFHKRQE
jgi:hypothetical protein